MSPYPWNTTVYLGPQPETAAPAGNNLYSQYLKGAAARGGNIYSQYLNQAGGGGVPQYQGSVVGGGGTSASGATYQGYIPSYGAPGGPVGSSPNTQLLDAVGGLLTPGLVPDIARQSAEVAAGRGVAGSGAGASTAVRMSEQNYLQRLGLANTLLSGEAGRELPYQITPYQRELLDIQRLQHTPAFTSRINTGGGGGGGGYPYLGGGGGGVTTPQGIDLSGFAGAGATNPYQTTPTDGGRAIMPRSNQGFDLFDPNWDTDRLGTASGGAAIDQILADLGLSGPGGGGIGSSDFDIPDFAIPDFNDYDSLWG